MRKLLNRVVHENVSNKIIFFSKPFARWLIIFEFKIVWKFSNIMYEIVEFTNLSINSLDSKIYIAVKKKSRSFVEKKIIFWIFLMQIYKFARIKIDEFVYKILFFRIIER